VRCAVGAKARSQLFQEHGHKAQRGGGSEHGVSFATSGLPVGEEGDIHTREACMQQLGGNDGVEAGVGVILTEDGIEGEASLFPRCWVARAHVRTIALLHRRT